MNLIKIVPFDFWDVSFAQAEALKTKKPLRGRQRDTAHELDQSDTFSPHKRKRSPIEQHMPPLPEFPNGDRELMYVQQLLETVRAFGNLSNSNATCSALCFADPQRLLLSTRSLRSTGPRTGHVVGGGHLQTCRLKRHQDLLLGWRRTQLGALVLGRTVWRRVLIHHRCGHDAHRRFSSKCHRFGSMNLKTRSNGNSPDLMEDC